MTITVKVLSIENLTVKVECVNDSNSSVIMRTPIKVKQKTRASIEKSVKDQLKTFNQPVWGGMSVVFYVSI